MDKQVKNIKMVPLSQPVSSLKSPRLLSALGEVSWRVLLLTALWMALWYAVWLWLRDTHGDHGMLALLPVFVGFTPLLLWGLYDFRLGLLFSVLASPLLIAPPIPHGFTQGFGDLFAISSIVGFMLRNTFSIRWGRFRQSNFAWLILVLVSAFVSMALSSVWGQEVQYGIKYSLAEIAGIGLVIFYLMVLVHEIRDRRDFIAVLHAVLAAVLIVILFSLASLNMSKDCIGGFGARTILTVNQAITSTFGNPNYHASYLVMAIPMILFFFSRAERGTIGRYAWGAMVVLLVFLVQATMSRSGLIGLVVIWLGWLAIMRWRPGTRGISVAIGLMLPMTPMLWWYPGCTCSDMPAQFCRFNISSTVSVESITAIPPKFHYGANVRLELLQNAFNIWQDNPITGVGIGLMGNYSSIEGIANRSHNVILTTLAEQGILGVLAWGGWWMSLAAVFWYNRWRMQISSLDYGLAFLALSFTVMSVQSLFLDYYRVLWIWQLGALILTWPLIGNDENLSEYAPATSNRSNGSPVDEDGSNEFSKKTKIL